MPDYGHDHSITGAAAVPRPSPAVGSAARSSGTLSAAPFTRLPDDGNREFAAILGTESEHQDGTSAQPDEVRAALQALRARTRTVIEPRFGISGGHALTPGQIIGRGVGLTAERCRQIEANGLRRVRGFADRASLAA
jgi:DNA-directed RNA polymerase sigma subunit (sigma70/sigma32)